MSYINFIDQTLQDCAKIALAYFGKVTGKTKPNDNNQVLTEADIKVGQYIIDKITKNFPQHNIIDEEAGVIDKKSNFTWVVDPIDGTSNFANGIPLYGIMLGLLKDDQSIAGGVVLPSLQEIYWAEKEGGAFCNKRRIHVTDEKKLQNTLIVYSIDSNPDFAFTQKECQILAKIITNIRNYRSSGCVFDGMMVAQGKYGGYLTQTQRIWDCVAEQIIIEEADGIYTDFFGKPINYSQPLSRNKDYYSVCCAFPILHSQLQKIINDKII